MDYQRTEGTIVTNKPTTPGLASAKKPITDAATSASAEKPIPAAPTSAKALLDAVMRASTKLASAGWHEPYALIMDATLYGLSLERLQDSSEETAADRLERRLQHQVISNALLANPALLVSLAGDPTTIYTAHEALTAFTGETGDGAYYQFRVFERFQYATRNLASITFLM